MSTFSVTALAEMQMFESLEHDQLMQLFDRHRESSHQPDQVIVMEQDWGESVFLLRSGLAKVRTYTMDGDEVVMSLLGGGDVFGEMAAISVTPNTLCSIHTNIITIKNINITPCMTSALPFLDNSQASLIRAFKSNLVSPFIDFS